MRCANCQQDINAGAVQCPFCLHNPFYPAFMDDGTREDGVASQPDDLFGTASVVVLGALVTLAIPAVGVPIALLGGYHFVKVIGRKLKGNGRS